MYRFLVQFFIFFFLLSNIQICYVSGYGGNDADDEIEDVCFEHNFFFLSCFPLIT